MTYTLCLEPSQIQEMAIAPTSPLEVRVALELRFRYAQGMRAGPISVAGIRLPSDSPAFLGLVGVHVVFALVCVLTGIIAMLSEKRPGRHPSTGTIYYWCLAVVFVSGTVLAAMRWAEDYPLFILGALSFLFAALGRAAHRRHWASWLTVHISGMGTSYVLLLTAFYVDNGQSLPLWRNLPTLTYWLAPSVVGLPLIARALRRHPLMRPSRAVRS